MMNLSKVRPFAAIAIALIVPGTAFAGPTPSTQAKLESCISASNGGDLALKDCYVDLANAEDARLNAGWQRLMKSVGGTRSKKGAALAAEQRIWIRFRVASCIHYMLESGTLDRLQSQMCYTNTISRRADEVEQLAAYYEDTL